MKLRTKLIMGIVFALLLTNLVSARNYATIDKSKLFKYSWIEDWQTTIDSDLNLVHYSVILDNSNLDYLPVGRTMFKDCPSWMGC